MGRVIYNASAFFTYGLLVKIIISLILNMDCSQNSRLDAQNTMLSVSNFVETYWKTLTLTC